MRMLVGDDNLEMALDTLQNVLGAHPPVRIVILPVDASLPKPAEEETKKEDAATAARELLYKDVAGKMGILPRIK